MAEYIEREALIAEFKRFGLGEHSLIERVFADGVYAVIENAPAANVVPVVHGRWGETLVSSHDYFGLVFGWKCSECEYHFEDRSKHRKTPTFMKYCPNCGARMDGE